VLDEARQATLFHAVRSGRPDSLSAHHALGLATKGGAEALGLGGVTGTLEKGKAADLAAFPLHAPEVQPVHDPAVALVHALAGRAEAVLVMVAGRVLVREGRVLAASSDWESRQHVTGERLREWRRRSAS
jgi:5-methylthioadenosine/S-adenosylhomocysteine deaminase